MGKIRTVRNVLLATETGDESTGLTGISVDGDDTTTTYEIQEPFHGTNQNIQNNTHIIHLRV